MTNAGVLFASALATPLAMLLACLSERLRNAMPALLALAPVPAFATALIVTDGSTLVLPVALLGFTLVLDTPGAMLLGATALLWSAAGAYAPVYLRNKPNGGSFAVWWLMTLTGNLGVFVAADLVSFYLFFTLVSLAAYGLVVYDSSPRAKRAAAVYVALAVLAEAFLLMGFVLLAAATSDGTLLIRSAVAALSTSPWRDATLALLVVGFGLKIGLVPLHFWIPLAHSAAPLPVSVVLSGTVVKAGVIGLIRFLPWEVAVPLWGHGLAAAGLFTALYGVAIGITQNNPKTILAYSTLSQMGLVGAVLGMGLATGNGEAVLGASYYAMCHILTKGALFLAVGVVAQTNSRRLWPVLLLAGVLALRLGGLPLTGGALAKLVVKETLGDGIAGTLATLSAIGSTLLMIHFLRCLMVSASNDSETAAPAGLVLPWLVAALASVVLPWALYPAIANESLYDALAPKVLWAALWPVLIGGLLSIGLLRWGRLLPRVPEGDILAAGNGAVHATHHLGAAMERIDSRLRQWPVAGVLFLVFTTILAMTMLTGR